MLETFSWGSCPWRMRSLRRAAEASVRHPLLAAIGWWVCARLVIDAWRATVAACARGGRALSTYLGKDLRDYVFGDLTRATLSRARAALSVFIGKDLSEYEFGDLSAATLQRLRTSFRRRYLSEAGLDAIVSSFFTQCAAVAARCLAREVVGLEELESAGARLREGVTGAVLFYALLRTLDDEAAAAAAARPHGGGGAAAAAAATAPCIVLANGLRVTAVGLPRALRPALVALLELKPACARLAPSPEERDALVVSLVGGAPVGGARARELDAVGRQLRSAAGALRETLHPSVFDANMEDVLVAVAEKQFGAFECDAPDEWQADNLLPGVPYR